MVKRFTIYKVHTQKFADTGFTLVELLVAMVVTAIVSSGILNAYLNVSSVVAESKKNTATSELLSGIIHDIGDDIKSAGEGIGNDDYLPTVEFGSQTQTSSPVTYFGNSRIGQAQNSAPITITFKSILTLRRSILVPLTLCQNLAAGAYNLPSTSAIRVATEDPSIGNPNCKPSPYQQSTTKLPILPANLRLLRDYTCNIIPGTGYEPVRILPDTGLDNCAAVMLSYGPLLLHTPAALSDRKGHLTEFVSNNVAPSGTIPGDYHLGVLQTSQKPKDDVDYPVGSPIYIMETRQYGLDTTGNLWLLINGMRIRVIATNIEQFEVSAKLYQDRVAKTLSSAPAHPCASDPSYSCQFNQNDLSIDPPYNWKDLALVKVTLKQKYDPTGGAPIPTSTDSAKLSATAEFYLRNNLSN